MTEFIFMIYESISWPMALIIGFLLLLLHGIFLTPPSELSLAAIGLYATIYEWFFFPAVLTTTAGNMVGCVILFKLSRRYTDWITNFLETSKFRYVRYLMEKARSDFHKHGHLFVLYGRFLPNIRSIFSIPAGFSNMTFSSYMLYSTIGCLAWSLLWVSVGFFVGRPLLTIIEAHQTFALILLIGTLLVVVFHRYHILRQLNNIQTH